MFCILPDCTWPSKYWTGQFNTNTHKVTASHRVSQRGAPQALQILSVRKINDSKST